MKKNEQVGFALSDVDTASRKEEVYKEPLKSSKNVVIVNNGTCLGLITILVTQ